MKQVGGPVIGPMTIAGIGIGEDLAQKFKLIGVKDSKMLSIKRIYLFIFYLFR